MLGRHIAAYLIACIMDMLIGDPHTLPHPVRLIGKLIAALDRILGPKDMELGGHKAVAGDDEPEGNISMEAAWGRRTADYSMRVKGILLWTITELMTVGTAALLLIGACHIHKAAGMAVEALLTYYIFAARSLYDESMRVYRDLDSPDDDRLVRARKSLSMIVGRDTDSLDEDRICEAAVETVAENTSDGVIAPMIYAVLGGPIAGYLYKAANTMDSMIGYKSARYKDLGWFAARADDVLNFIPARISALLLIGAAWICKGDIYAKNALRIYKRDRNVTESPNAGQCESVMAGALGLRLGGYASYGGKIIDKVAIGDGRPYAVISDIADANRLMLMAATIMGAIAIGLMTFIYYML